jgi:hypothetical protein
VRIKRKETNKKEIGETRKTESKRKEIRQE